MSSGIGSPPDAGTGKSNESELGDGGGHPSAPGSIRPAGGFPEQLARGSIQVPDVIPTIGPPLLERGVGLAQTVIWVITGTIAALIVTLCVVEYSQMTNTRRVDDRVLAMVETRSRKGLKESFDTVSDALAGRPTTTQQSVVKAELAIANLRSVGILTIEQTDTLTECLITVARSVTATAADLPSAITQVPSPIPKQCTLALSTARAAADVARDDVESIRALREIAKDVRDAQQSTRSFWLQVAQLILLNLLLPVLTALLGYIFGSYRGGDA
jgi:hypothetical protein